MVANLLSSSISYLLTYKSLSDKDFVLYNLYQIVFQQLPDDKLEDKIVKSSEIIDHINEMIYVIDDKLKISSTLPPASYGIRGMGAGLFTSHTPFNQGRLPKIELLLFTENITEYQEFWDTFKVAEENLCT